MKEHDEANNGIGTLKLGQDHFQPNSFQFIIIHLLLYHRRYLGLI
jgi:hypothetical protein